MVGSMSRKGNCYDNACIESFHSILKREFNYLEKFRTREQALQRIFDYIEVWYNRERIHSSIGYLLPIEYEKDISNLCYPKQVDLGIDYVRILKLTFSLFWGVHALDLIPIWSNSQMGLTKLISLHAKLVSRFIDFIYLFSHCFSIKYCINSMFCVLSH